MQDVRQKLHRIVFEAETPMGRLFDIVLLWSILLSLLSVTLESVSVIREQFGPAFIAIEWFFTILFTIEYLLRCVLVDRPVRYIFSFYGLVDLLSIVPTYLSLYLTGTQSLMVIRSLRLLRMFRVLKLTRFMGEASVLRTALRASLPKIAVFLTTVLSMVVIMGTLMFMLEGPENGYTSIPKGMYWAIVTMTTVGYGDIAPQTVLGQTFASILMIVGYGVIAVPTGIVSTEIASAQQRLKNTLTCHSCAHEGHQATAKFCLMCGAELD